MAEEMPKTIGLCPDGAHTGEFYMPDPKPGDLCPECTNELTIYRPDPSSGQDPLESPVDALARMERHIHERVPATVAQVKIWRDALRVALGSPEEADR